MSDDEMVPTEYRMPSGRPNLDLVLTLVREVNEGFSAVLIRVVPKEGHEAPFDGDDEPAIAVPVALWRDFVGYGDRLREIGLKQVLRHPTDPAGGFVVAVGGEPNERAVACLIDNRGYWVRTRPLAEPGQVVSEDVPAPPGSVYMLLDGKPRIVVPTVPLMLANGRMAPGTALEQSDVPADVLQRDRIVAGFIDPRTTTLKTGDGEATP